MIGLGIILAHLLGDYVFQNNWMANQKTSRWGPALIHGAIHSLIYYALAVWVAPLETPLWQIILGVLVIGATHAVIDRYRLVKQAIWGINQAAPRSSRYTWAEAKANAGYEEKTPVWMKTWLMIIFDNTVHLTINALVFLLLIL